MKTGPEKRQIYDLDTELSLIGSVISNNQNYYEIKSILSEADFYSSVHRKIYLAISSLGDQGYDFDVNVLQSKLSSLNILEQIGGVSYIEKSLKVSCHDKVCSQYARIIKDLSTKRTLQELTETYNHVVNDSYNEKSGDEIFSDLMLDMTSIHSGKSDTNTFSTTEDAVYDLFHGETGRSIDTGISIIDKEWPIMTKGVTIIAGRPSNGKSTLAAEVVLGAANLGSRVDFYSLEMSKAQLAARLISSVMRKDEIEIPYNSIYNKKKRLELDSYQHSACSEYSKNLPQINFNDASSMTMSDILCTSMGSRNIKDKPDLIVIDYLDNVSKSDLKNSEMRDDQKIGSIVHRGRQYAKDYDCAVIVVVQLNRQVDQKSPMGRPFIAALKNSGEIEQHADSVLFTYRKCRYIEEKYNEEDMPEDEEREYLQLLNKIEIICAKQRMGPTGSQLVDCDIKCNHISSLDDEI